jgi:outer membrane protein assembly factor BamB
MDHPTDRKPLRLWPGVIAASIIVLMRFALPLVMPDASSLGVIAGLAGTVAVIVWWAFFSRAPWPERVGAVVVMAIAVAATRPFLHESIVGGMMGMMFAVYAVPTVLGIAFVAWAVLTRRLSDRTRRVSMVATILVACGVWTLARTDGISSAGAELAWRWTPTPEERLLAHANDEPKALPAAVPESLKESPTVKPDVPPAAAAAASAGPAKPVEAKPAVAPAPPPPADPVAAGTAPEWPGFRGPRRDSIVRGVRINADWSSAAPVKMWQRPIGPGWSSFAVQGDLLYTQEQRGEDETVACYRVSTGEPVWRHRDPVRFWESNAGAGPRATPTLSNGRVYAFGATGILNALDARTGAVVWSRNVATDLSRAVPDWGFASSPLVIDDLVIVAASGTLTAYDLATGKPRWVGPRQLGSYSSPHRVAIDGVTQILLLSGTGVASLAPATGTLLWEHQWGGGTTIIQPAVTDDGDILINSIAMTGGAGTRRLAVAHAADKWTVEERWTSNGLKPYFNDFVVHKGHAFGFDGNILSCIDLTDGKRKWKGGRYGNGQLVLLPDQDLLLVLSEDGELALVSATPDQYKELARLPGIEGKTWNHPALVGDVLLIRNGEQMAAFRLAPERTVTR